MPKYTHPYDMIQQYTEICLRCGQNTYDTDDCVAPPKQEPAKFKRGDRVIVRHENAILHLGNGFWNMRKEITSKEDRPAVVSEVCEYHYNCYKVINKPDNSFIQSHCVRFDQVRADKKSKDWPSQYKLGDVVLAATPRPNDSSFGLEGRKWTAHGGKPMGSRNGSALVEFRLLCQSVDEGFWLCETPHWYEGAGGLIEDTAEKILHESAFEKSI